jgi:hypothetical protein
VFRVVLITLGVMVALFVFMVLRNRIRIRNVHLRIETAMEEGEYTRALDLLDEIENFPKADSIRMAILREGITETHRKAMWEYENDPGESLDYWVPVIALVQRYFQEAGFRNEPETYLYMTYLADAFTAFESFEEAGNTLMEIVWNDETGYMQEEACVRAIETYLTALEFEEGVDSASIIQNQLEALQVLHAPYPGNPGAVPLALTVASGCLDAGRVQPAFEIAREVFLVHQEPGVRIHAAAIAATALEGLGLHEEALIWRERATPPDSLEVLPPPGEGHRSPALQGVVDAPR